MVGISQYLLLCGEHGWRRSHFNVETLPKLYVAKDNLYYPIFALSVLIMGLVSDGLGIRYVYYLAAFLYWMSSVLAVIRLKKTAGPAPK